MSEIHSLPEATLGRLLVVDDDIHHRTTLRMFLQMAGYQIDEASNGAEACRAFESEPTRYDAIVMDLNMPVMDGYQAIRQIRTTSDSVPIIVISSAADTLSLDSRDRVNAVIGKPFSLSNFVRQLSDAIPPRIATIDPS